MSDDDKTPTDNRSTIEMFADDMRATKVAAQNTETSQLQMHEDFKAFRVAVQELREEVSDYKRRAWTPAVVSTIAAVVSLLCAVSAAVR